MNIQQYIQSLDLALDQAHRGDCPVCNGKGTFTATATIDGLKYNCYKAGCKVRGVDTSTLTAEQLQQALARRIEAQREEEPTPIPVPEGFTKRLSPLYKSGLDKYHLHPTKHDTYFDVRQDRLCLPVKYKGQVVDFVGRSLTGRSPKWLRYSNAHAPYIFGTGKAAVLVEDCFSAISAGSLPTCTGVALLGTNVLKEYERVILQYDKIIVALDPDARSKALAIVKELRAKHPNVYALNLQDDLKYETERDMTNLKVMSER